MFNIIFIIFFAIIGFCGYQINNEVIHTVGISSMVLSFAWGVISLICNVVSFMNQLELFERLRSKLKKLLLYDTMRLELINTLKLYLGEKYPEFEDKLIKRITDSDAEINMVLNYPETKTSKTFIELTKQIVELTKKSYNLKDDIQDDCATIRFYRASKWEYFKPTIPADVLTQL